METDAEAGWMEELGGEATVVLAGVGACTTAGDLLLEARAVELNSHSVRFGKRFAQLPQTGRCSSHLTFLTLQARHPKRDFVWLRFVDIFSEIFSTPLAHGPTVVVPSIHVLDL